MKVADQATSNNWFYKQEKMIQGSHIRLFLLIFTLVSLFSSCDKKEVKYEFYDGEEKIIKSRGEYLNGVLDGVLIYYFIDGKKQETSEWNQGVRNGRTIAYYPNGDIANEYSYRMGKMNKLKIYYESGILKYAGQIDENNIFYNAKNYEEDGALLEMTPSIKFNADTLLLGDTLKIVGSLSNVEDTRYLSGNMILGSGFADLENDFLKDTLAIIASDTNVYRISMVPQKKGVFRFVAQLAFRFKTNEESNRVLSDSLSFFSTGLKVVVK